MKGLYLRGNIYWLRYADAGGQIIYESSKTSNKREAEKLLLKRRNEVMQGVKFGQSATLGEAVALYLKYANAHCKSVKSIRSFCHALVKILSPKLKLNDISLKDFEHVQNALIRRGLKKYSVNVQMAYFKALLYRAIELGLCNPTLATIIKKVKKLRGGVEQRLEYLDLKDIEKVSSFLSGESKVKFVVFVNTGMRLMELHRLKWRDIRDGFIYINESKSGKPRQIPMNDSVKIALSLLPRAINSDTPVFTKNAKSFSLNLKQALKQAGITKPIVVHSLRHTFATHLAMGGVDLPTLRELLGHSSLAMVMRYAHLSNEHAQKAVNKINAAFQRAVSL